MSEAYGQTEEDCKREAEDQFYEFVLSQRRKKESVGRESSLRKEVSVDGEKRRLHDEAASPPRRQRR